MPFKQGRFPTEKPENPGKNTMLGSRGVGAHFYCKFHEKNSPEAPYNYSASFWTSNFSDSLFGKFQTLPFYGSWTWRTWPWLPKPILFICGDTRTLQRIQEGIPHHFQNIIWGHSRISNFESFGKACPPHLKFRLCTLLILNLWKDLIFETLKFPKQRRHVKVGFLLGLYSNSPELQDRWVSA